MIVPTIERLEQRRLFSLTVAGPATTVPGAGVTGVFDSAVAANGDSIVAFVILNTSTLQVVRYSPTGAQAGSPLTIVSGKQISTVSVSMDDAGDAVVAWNETPSAGSDQLFFEKISSAGVLGSAVNVAGPVQFIGAPAVSMDSTGGFFIGWEQQVLSTDDITAQIQAFDATGTSRAAAFTAHSIDHLKSLDHFTIASKPDGAGAVFAVTDDFESADDTTVFGQVTTSALVSATAGFDSGRNESLASIAVNADGSFEIGYTTFQTLGGSGGEPTDTSLLVQNFNASSVAQGSPIVVSPASGVGATLDDSVIDQLSLAATAGDGFIVAYTRIATTTVGPVFINQYDAAGAADIDGPVLISAHGIPAVGADADGNAVVAISQQVDGNPLSVVRVSTSTDFASIQHGILTISGTAGDDAISVAVSGSNLIATRNGDSKTFAAADVTAILIQGRDGNDSITNATALPSSLYGGAGKDTLIGGSGGDLLSAGGGNDVLIGNTGRDRLYGGEGRDHLYGGGGDDQLFGGAAGDWLYGNGGNDNLNGEGGLDRLYSDYATGSATLHGGAGNDIFVSKNALADHLFGDSGNDTSIADATDLLTSIELFR